MPVGIHRLKLHVQFMCACMPEGNDKQTAAMAMPQRRPQRNLPPHNFNKRTSTSTPRRSATSLHVAAVAVWRCSWSSSFFRFLSACGSDAWTRRTSREHGRSGLGEAGSEERWRLGSLPLVTGRERVRRRVPLPQQRLQPGCVKGLQSGPVRSEEPLDVRVAHVSDDKDERERLPTPRRVKDAPLRGP